MLDIDHFKNYNDAFGHAAGDLALQMVAGALRRTLRRGDYAARYGGEEFVLILPDTTAPAGALIAERLRASVAALLDQPDSELPGPVTVSVGVAAFPEHGADRDLLLQAADLAMYLAKHIGRNQVCLANELGTVRGLEALFAQVTSHLALPSARWGPHLVSDLERRFTRLASLRVDPDERGLEEGGEAAYRYTVQTVTALATTIDAKDHYTEGHSRHVAALAQQLARAAGCSREDVEQIRVGGLLHDIGKIGIPETILNKPGRLTDEEWALMRSHPDIGARILAPIAALGAVIPLVRHHHERWDGQGYPLRLHGEHIPLGARIIAICDAYDTMVSDRPYRRALGHHEAVARLHADAGAQFDPRLVDLFATLPLDADQPGYARFLSAAARD
ncbi:MAG TPA: diguanylate cyclase [Thermomicrobiales bacterium]|nr:diguanylate cyclase [Thermomicrobiales bacterium]